MTAAAILRVAAVYFVISARRAFMPDAHPVVASSFASQLRSCLSSAAVSRRVKVPLSLRNRPPFDRLSL